MNKGRVVSVSKVGPVSISKYDIEVNNEDVKDFLIKDVLGITDYDETIRFYGKVTITVEELPQDTTIINTFANDNIVETSKLPIEMHKSEILEVDNG